MNIINETIRVLEQQINNQIAEIENKYNITQQEFEIGDLVYYLNSHGEIVPAIIDEIYLNNTSGSFVFYWIHESGSKIGWWNKFTFFLLINIPFLQFRYKVPTGYPDYGVLAGDDIFRTKEEAEDILLLYNLLNILADYNERYSIE